MFTNLLKLQDIQNITAKTETQFAFFGNLNGRAQILQEKLFPTTSIKYIDKSNYWHIVPTTKLDNTTIDNLIVSGYSFDKNQTFNKYTITLHNTETLLSIHNYLRNSGYNTIISSDTQITYYNNTINSGYHIVLSPHTKQIIITCLQNSEQNDEIMALQKQLQNLPKKSKRYCHPIIQHIKTILHNATRI